MSVSDFVAQAPTRCRLSGCSVLPGWGEKGLSCSLEWEKGKKGGL